MDWSAVMMTTMVGGLLSCFDLGGNRFRMLAGYQMAVVARCCWLNIEALKAALCSDDRRAAERRYLRLIKSIN